MVIFWPVCADNRDLIGGFCDFTDRWRSFIRCYRCLISDE
jgi:hypothetical protein